MSRDKAAVTAATIQAMASELYGLALDDARAARIAAELGQYEAGARAAGTLSPDASPALFRQLLLAGAQAGARRP